MSEALIAELCAAWKDRAFEQRLGWLTAHLPQQKIVCSTSFGMEDQAITHTIADQHLDISLFTLDTGRLFEQTYQTFAATQKRYPELVIDSYMPDADEVRQLVAEQGVNGFYDAVEKRQRCCHVRKVVPLAKALDGADIWVSGLRHAQSDRRADLPMAEYDAERGLIKCYPLLDVSDETLQDYITGRDIPVNPLHAEGFASIGCAPCTRAVQPGEHPRAGRWWWEHEEALTGQECGLHMQGGKLVRIKQEDSHA